MSPQFKYRTREYVAKALTDLLTKAMAVAYTGIAWHAIEDHHPVCGTVLALLIVAMAAAFGQSTFKFFLTRYEVKHSLSEAVSYTRTDNNQTTRAITERRDFQTGHEATP